MSGLDTKKESPVAPRLVLEYAAAGPTQPDGDKDVEKRLKALEKLKEEGLLTPEEYAEKRKRLLRGAETR